MFSGSSVAVHGDCYLQQFSESGSGSMVAKRHCFDDHRELLEFRLLSRQKRRGLEERNDLGEEIRSSSYHVDQRAIAQAIPLDVTASAESLLDQVEHLSTIAVLAHVKFRH